MSVKQSLKLGEEHGVRVFEKILLKRIFGTQWNEILGDGKIKK
jgi:hypothetical protein